MGAVSACRAADQTSVVVGQRDAEAVDLQLRHAPRRRQVRAPPLCTRSSNALSSSSLRVVQAEHRRNVRHRLEPLNRPPGHPLGRRIGRDEIRMRRFELLELVEQAIELFVGDFGGVLNVVELLVTANRVTKRSRALLGSGAGHWSQRSRASAGRCGRYRSLEST